MTDYYERMTIEHEIEAVWLMLAWWGSNSRRLT
jgi:hypothetical protein